MTNKVGFDLSRLNSNYLLVSLLLIITILVMSIVQSDCVKCQNVKKKMCFVICQNDEDMTDQSYVKVRIFAPDCWMEWI